MHEPIPYATINRPDPAVYPRGGLIFFGVVSILLGTPSALMATFGSLGLVRLWTRRAPAFAVTILGIVVLLNAIAATVFIWTGIGSIRCRRWVRPVIIGLGWPTMVTFLLMAAGLMLCAMTYVPSGGADDGQWIALVGVLYLIPAAVAAAFVIFYTRRSVRETLAAYDPSPSWTEASALPVFVGSASLVLFGLLTMALSLVGAVPVFGVYATGALAVVLCMVAGATMVASGLLMHLGQAWGWWVALGVVAGGFASAIVTFCRLGMLEFYRRGGLNPFAVNDLEQVWVMSGVTPIVFVGIVGLISVGYLVWMRGYLVRDDEVRALAA